MARPPLAFSGGRDGIPRNRTGSTARKGAGATPHRSHLLFRRVVGVKLAPPSQKHKRKRRDTDKEVIDVDKQPDKPIAPLPLHKQYHIGNVTARNLESLEPDEFIWASVMVAYIERRGPFGRSACPPSNVETAVYGTLCARGPGIMGVRTSFATSKEPTIFNTNGPPRRAGAWPCKPVRIHTES
jgi:hypothetical protein